MFAIANLQLYLAEHQESFGSNPERFAEIMARAVQHSSEGMCVSAVASNILGEEMADAFLAEITMDMRHMGLFVAQAQRPDVILILENGDPG